MVLWMRFKIIILIIVIVLMIFFLFYERPFVPEEFITNRTVKRSENLFFIYETIRYPAKIRVTEFESNLSDIKVGIAGETWQLNFGYVPVGMKQRKFFDMANPKETDIKVTINTYGNISPMIEFEKNDFILHKDETMKVGIIIEPLKTTQPGNYIGEIDIFIVKPKYSFLSNYLKWF